MPRIAQVEHVDGAAQALAELPEELGKLLYEQLRGFRDRELPEGDHVEVLLVDGRVIRVNFFVDTDGTLWIERLGF